MVTFSLDITVNELEKNLQIKSVIVKSSGEDFVKSILNEKQMQINLNQHQNMNRKFVQGELK